MEKANGFDSNESTAISEHGLKVLATLKKAVAKELERKRKLGHYAVIWDGKKPVQRGDDAPTPKE